MENKAVLFAARIDVEALSLGEDPLVVAQACVDNLTGILARLLNDDGCHLFFFFIIIIIIIIIYLFFFFLIYFIHLETVLKPNRCRTVLKDVYN
jgi:hypothetical protein